MVLQNVPAELRQLPQWVSAGPDKVPLNPRTGQPASTIDPSTWGTFDEAWRSGYKHVGLVLTASDPYAVVDLDNKEKNPCPPELWAKYETLVAGFNSYVERSLSGRGYHIVLKAVVPGGGIRDDSRHVEFYSDKRFIIFTGDVVRNMPIAADQRFIDAFVESLPRTSEVELHDEPELMCDRDLVEMAEGAANAEKFIPLANGRWQELGYPSQSEADFALMSMLAFYTQSNEQTRRIFRYSGLGQRAKAQRDDYLNTMLAKIRATQPPPPDFEAVKGIAEQARAAVPVVKQVETSAERTPDTSTDSSPLELPPGIIGEIATYIYQSSVRPVPDVSLAAAIAFCAGIVGRSYNISGTGLNQYLILIAKTGAGKEGAISGINRLISAVRPRIPMVDVFLGPSVFASGQALIRRLDTQPCFVSVLGEFGLTLQQLCDPSASASQVQLRRVLLDLYTKSGWHETLGASVYADAEKNTKIIQAPNVTILGETTPETFFEGLDQSHITEGLIPRFCIIQYEGARPPRNDFANGPPSAALLEKLIELITIAQTTTNNQQCVPVQLSEGGKHLLDSYDKRADAEINSTTSDAELQLWNRAHLKALKLAALVAVGCNPHQPIISEEIALWSLKLIERDIKTILKRFRSGDVGRGDSKLSADLRRIINAYLAGSSGRSDVPPELAKDCVIPYNFLVRRTSNLAAFRKDRRGSTASLKTSLTELVEGGLLSEIAGVDLFLRYKYRGKAWVVTPAWRLE